MKADRSRAPFVGSNQGRAIDDRRHADLGTVPLHGGSLTDGFGTEGKGDGRWARPGSHQGPEGVKQKWASDKSPVQIAGPLPLVGKQASNISL